MLEFVDIAFDCIPLKSVGQLRPPLDASGAYQARCERIAAAIERYSVSRAYWLENAHCAFRLANSEVEGMVRFEFDGVITTDVGDAKTEQLELEVRLVANTCQELPKQVEDWFVRQVHRAVGVEFDRYIAAGQLSRENFPRSPDDVGL